MKLKTLLFALVLVLVGPVLGFAATGTVAPVPYHSFYDNSGDPCSSCRIFTYEAGTSTKTNTYNSVDLSVANANPIVLDSAGRAKIFLAPGSYKFVLAAAGSDDPPASPIWTIDSVTNIPPAAVNVDVDATAGESLAAGDAVYLSAGDGGRTAGRWYKTDADLDYASTTAVAAGFTTGAISSAASGTVRVAGRVTGLAGLSVGSVYYISTTAGAITSSPPASPRKIGIADSTTTLIASHWIPLPEASATIAGIISTTAQDLPGVKNFKEHPTFEPGTSSTAAQVYGRLTSDVTATGNVGAGEDTIFTYPLPADTLSATGRSFTAIFHGTGANNANSKTWRFKFNGTTILDTGAWTNEAVDGWRADLTCTATAANTQRCVCTWMTWTSGVAADQRGPKEVATACTTTGTCTILVTGEATADNDIVRRVGRVYAD